MAISQGTVTLAITSQERSWRINIETAMGADPVVTVFRETVKTDASSKVISKEPAPQAQRALSVVAAETQPFTPATPGVITAAELATLVAARADMWRAADIAASSQGASSGLKGDTT
jgi:hypothetical protein